MENLLTKDILATRISEYLPSPKILARKPAPEDLELRDEYRENRPGDEFSLVLHEDKLVMVPSWHPLNSVPISANSIISATGSIETLTMEPVFSREKNDVVSGNIVLLGPRMDRLYNRSLPARETTLAVGKDTFAQGIIDLMAVLGKDVLVGSDGNIGIGSIRVTVAMGIGKFGKSNLTQKVAASVEAYLGHRAFPEKAYSGKGITVSAGPNQRFDKFRGKHASHYGEAGRIGAISKRVGADEAILFAPYLAKNPDSVSYLPRHEVNKEELTEAMLDLALANGLGAELLAVKKDGGILLPPVDVNRLIGVTADHIVDSLAPSLGISAEISPFSLRQIEEGEIVGLFFAGNAARIAAIGEINLHDSEERILKKISMNIPETTTRLIEAFERQARDVDPASSPFLITKVDLDEGKKARKILEKAFSDWL